MIDVVDRKLVALSRWAAMTSAGLVVLASALVWVGWLAEMPKLSGAWRGKVATNPTTALAFGMAAVSLFLLARIAAGPAWRSRPIAQGLAIIVFLIGLQRLLGYSLGWQHTLDEMILARRVAGNPMAPNTAACFAMIGLSLAMLDWELGAREWRPAVWLTAIPCAVCVLALVGYLYEVKEFYGFDGFVGMAPNTAVCFVILIIGIGFARPLKEPAVTLVSRTDGGRTARRLLPVAIAIPLIFGWFRLKGQHKGWYDTESGVAIFAVAVIVVFVVMVYLSGRNLKNAEVRRRQTEEKLAASEAFYHSLVETLPQNIFRKDITGRFTFVNSNFCEEMKLPPEKIIGKTDYDFFPRGLADRYRRDDQDVIRSGKAFETVEEHVTPSGDKLYVQVIKTAVRGEGGRVMGTQGIFWDVTEKKRGQEMLEETNRQLEESVQSEKAAYDQLKEAQTHLVQTEKLAGLGQMVAGVAHEINNPLAFVSNNVAVIQRDVNALKDLLKLYQEGEASFAPELRAKIGELAERIDLKYTMENLDGLFSRSREGMRRIQQIVKDLRDFARLDASDFHEIDLNAGIESTINIILGHARRKQITINKELGALPRITCYPAKVNQVIMNLLSNAIDASPDGSEVCIRSRSSDGSVVVEVEDHGCGIPEQIRQRIFDPFFTTKPPGEGTGLGLSISYGIVKDHGGAISVASEVGKGTTFEVRLPVKR